MPRPIRKKLKFDEDSVNNLLQEIYNDSHNIKAKITRLFTKWESKVKDGEDIAILSKSVTDLINAEIKNQDQKIMILKYLKEVVFAKDKNTDDSNDRLILDKDAKAELLKMVKESSKK